MIARVVVLGVVALGCGCSTTRVHVNPERTAIQQLLASEAMDDALARLDWPVVEGRTVVVEVASEAAAQDDQYLKGAAERTLLRRGARVVADRAHADLLLTVLSGGVGIERKQTVLGLPEIETIVVTIPAFGLYDSTLQRGYAKAEILLREARNGRLLHDAGPVLGQTFYRAWGVLFYRRTDTDTSLDP